MRYWYVGWLVVVFVVACGPPAAVKRGDSAAAVGDWKRAEAEYRTALASDPDSDDLRRKHNHAKENAIEAANATGRRCFADKDFSCTISETEYVLSLDPVNQEADKLRQNARDAYAEQLLTLARQAAAADNVREAYEYLDKIRADYKDAKLLADVAGLERELSAAAVLQAAELTAQGDAEPPSRAIDTYEDAIWLLERATRADEKHSRALNEVRSKRDVAIDSAYLELVGRGDAAVNAHLWDDAYAAYSEAARLRPGGQADSRARYVRHVIDAEADLASRAFQRSADEFAYATQTGEDVTGYAQDEWERVVPRLYRVRFDAVLISPVKPGTDTPWIGPRNKALYKFVGTVAGAAAGMVFGAPEVGAKLGAEVGKAAGSIPRENQPSLRAYITLPDGRTMETKRETGLYAVFDSEFVILSNEYDRRLIRFHVVHAKKSGEDEDVGVVSMSLGDLIAHRQPAEFPAALYELAVTTEPVSSGVDGYTRNLTQIDDENRASKRSPATTGSTGYRLTQVKAYAATGDVDDDLTSAPDPLLLIAQGADWVYKSTTADDTRSATWRPPSMYLFVRDDDQFTMRLYDADDVSASDEVAVWTFSGQQVASGTVEGKTQAGTVVTVTFEKRAVGPE